MTGIGGQGSGPGVITSDGCAVDVYELLGESPDRAEMVASACPVGGSILDLGCGAGAVTSPLARMGFRVVAVDHSAEMLERITGAETVLADFLELRLEERFDVVLVASFLISLADAELRRGLLECCRRHVADDGQVVLEWRNAAWWDRIEPRHGVREDGLQQIYRDIERGDGVLEMTEEYRFQGASWEHRYAVHKIADEELLAQLRDVGLELDEWLSDDHMWLSARPV